MTNQENNKKVFNVNGTTYLEGQRVSIIIPTCPPRRIIGELIVVTMTDAYIETPFGPIAGRVETLEDES